MEAYACQMLHGMYGLAAALLVEPELFRWLARAGNVERMEMYRTFNCGVGMVICVAAEQSAAALALLRTAGENAWRLGHIDAAPTGSERVRLLGC